MNAGQPMIQLGNHPTLGPPWIEIGLPSTIQRTAEGDAYLQQLHGDLQQLLAVVRNIESKLCKLPFYKRLWYNTKRLVAKGFYVAFSR